MPWGCATPPFQIVAIVSVAEILTVTAVIDLTLVAHQLIIGGGNLALDPQIPHFVPLLSGMAESALRIEKIKIRHGKPPVFFYSIPQTDGFVNISLAS